jgi:hypothetical protein
MILAFCVSWMKLAVIKMIELDMERKPAGLKFCVSWMILALIKIIEFCMERKSVRY